MNNNTILALVFLMAGTLLTTAVVTMVPAAYAEEDDHDDDNGDGYGNKIKADESQVAVADCDNNEVERAGFDCVAIEEDGFLGIPMGPRGEEAAQ
jgi:hypothetical protein